MQHIKALDRIEGRITYRRALELARDAYKRIPFYKWFYDKNHCNPFEASYSKLPLLSKAFFFEYEDATGKPYHGVRNPPLSWTLYTQGTTGRPLQCLQTPKSLALSIVRSLEPFYKRPYRCLAIEMPEGARIGFFFEDFESLGVQVAKIPLEKVFNLEEVSLAIKALKPNFIFDLSSRWAAGLISRRLSLSEKGIKVVVLAIVPSTEDKALLVKDGVRVLALFGCSEVGIFAATCPHSDSFHAQEEGLLVNVLNENGLQTEGKGKLVITGGPKLFPFIKYFNGDIVVSRKGPCDCGFNGVSFDFVGRFHQVKVPDVSGVHLDIERIREGFKKDTGSTPFILQLNFEEKGAIFTMLAILFPSDFEKPLLLDSNWSKRAMNYGAGCFDERFLHSVPVVKVPTEFVFPIGDEKRRYFLNVERKLPEQYEPLVSMLGQLLKINVVRPMK